MINTDIQVPITSPAVKVEERRASRYCMNTLVFMDIVHAITGFITLLYRHAMTVRRLTNYTIISTVLSVNGIFFNILVRTEKFVNFMTRREWCPMYWDDDSIAKRELIINIGSTVPTWAMMIYGQVVWDTTHDLTNQGPAGVFAWFTAWLYVAKSVCFPLFVVYLDYKFTKYVLRCNKNK